MQNFELDDLIPIRPRFSVKVPLSADEIKTRIKTRLERDGATCNGKMAMGHVVLDIPEKDLHFWSPQMSFDIVDAEDGSSELKGLIGPKPHVWTLFMFFYFIIGTAGMFISIYGLSKWQLGNFHSAVFGFPIALVIMSTAYFIGKSAEKIGHDQIDTLKDFLRSALRGE